jgi:uncharacterized membrane protein
MTKAVFCISKSINQTEVIITNLKLAGFSNNDISVLFPDKTTTKDFAHEKHTKAPEGAAIGGAVGFSVGAGIGLLAGIGAIAIPGVGPLIAAGPIMGALSGASVGAATGGLTGSLIGLGIPEYEAKRYEGKIIGGNTLISVHTKSGDAIDKVKDIFKFAHAEDISSTEEETV